MAMSVRRTSSVTWITLLECAKAFEGWNRTAFKILMGGAHPSIQNVHMDTCALGAWARVGAVQRWPPLIDAV